MFWYSWYRTGNWTSSDETAIQIWLYHQCFGNKATRFFYVILTLEIKKSSTHWLFIVFYENYTGGWLFVQRWNILKGHSNRSVICSAQFIPLLLSLWHCIQSGVAVVKASQRVLICISVTKAAPAARTLCELHDRWPSTLRMWVMVICFNCAEMY